MNDKHKFKLYRGFETLLETEATFIEARKKADELANEHGRVEMHCYNDGAYRWEMLGTYLGNREVINCFGDRCIIDADYRNMWTKK